ncbi:hypothetical protein RJ640_022332 [Escallonia rubra]|uniref:Uncharacterized protein n=1 Tax=Escallonia rubra TaxID=112253 RepID=A0AA88QQN3_9ASTE|nr:hypothetical protein RJ640_022332 [Escallonia rubra]
MAGIFKKPTLAVKIDDGGPDSHITNQPAARLEDERQGGAIWQYAHGFHLGVRGDNCPDPETITSTDNAFKLGFFTPFNSTKRYVGIMYNFPVASEPQVVWVANRDSQ